MDSAIHHVNQDIQEMLIYVGRIVLLVMTIQTSFAERLVIMEEELSPLNQNVKTHSQKDVLRKDFCGTVHADQALLLVD